METNKEFAEDIFLGIGFLFVSFFSGWRTILYFEPFGRYVDMLSFSLYMNS